MPLKKGHIAFYEMTIVFHGKLLYKINNKNVLLQERDIIFLPPGTLRERPESTETVDYFSFNFRGDDTFSLPIKIPKSANSLISNLIACIDKIQADFYYESQTQVAHLLLCIIENLQMQLSRHSKPLITEIKQFLYANLSRALSWKEIEKIFHYSPLYLNTVFKKETGVPLMRFFTQLKIEEAKSMLSSSKLPLIKVAKIYGFDDYNYFSRAFKKYTGITPTQYRNQFFL